MRQPYRMFYKWFLLRVIKKFPYPISIQGKYHGSHHCLSPYQHSNHYGCLNFRSATLLPNYALLFLYNTIIEAIMVNDSERYMVSRKCILVTLFAVSIHGGWVEAGP